MLTGYWQERGQESENAHWKERHFFITAAVATTKQLFRSTAQSFLLPLQLSAGPQTHTLIDLAVLEEMSCVIYIVLSQKLLNHWAGWEKTLPMQWMNGVYTLLSSHHGHWWASKPNGNIWVKQSYSLSSCKEETIFQRFKRGTFSYLLSGIRFRMVKMRLGLDYYTLNSLVHVCWKYRSCICSLGGSICNAKGHIAIPGLSSVLIYMKNKFQPCFSCYLEFSVIHN